LRAEVRRLHSPDVPDLRGYTPPAGDDFSVLIQIFAGPVGSDGEESFDIEVVTPNRLASRAAEKGPISGRHLLIVESFDYASIERWIRAAVAACDGSDWAQVADRLARIGRWEFEDYAP
jgi:hypothetical protein